MNSKFKYSKNVKHVIKMMVQVSGQEYRRIYDNKQ